MRNFAEKFFTFTYLILQASMKQIKLLLLLLGCVLKFGIVLLNS